MSEAAEFAKANARADHAKALRAELAKVEKEAKAEKAAERARAREAALAEADRETAEYRAEHYDGTAGDNSNYLAYSKVYNGGVEFDVVEWTNGQATVALTREQVLALIADLTKLVK